MSCPYSKKIKEYLDENLSSNEMTDMEKHIEICQECQKCLENLLEKPLKLDEEPMEIDDEVLVGKIKAHKKGVRRIRIYSVFGFLLGIFSLKYTSDNFILTKAIMALPYKLADFMLGIFFSRNKLNLFQQEKWHMIPRGMGYFPYNPILNFLTELITPALVAMFLAMILAYLTSDKRVFQRKKIIRFIASATIVFIIWLGMVYSIYNNSLNRIRDLRDIKSITIYEQTENSSSWLIRIDEDNMNEERYNSILSGVADGRKAENYTSINETEGLRLNISFKGGAFSIAHLDMDRGIMLMQDHIYYQLSDDVISNLLELRGKINNEE